MKCLVCEFCGSSDLVKEDDCFICRSCGHKYGFEAAGELLKESEGAPEGRKNQIDNLLSMAVFELKAGNAKEALSFANCILEADAGHTRAHLAKAKACQSLAGTDPSALDPFILSGKKAIETAAAKDRLPVEKAVYEGILAHAIDLLTAAAGNAEDAGTDGGGDAVSLMEIGRSLALDEYYVPDSAVERIGSLHGMIAECAEAVQRFWRRYQRGMAAAGINVSEKEREDAQDGAKPLLERAESGKEKYEAYVKEYAERYWAEHAEEKAKLGSVREQLLAGRQSLTAQKEELANRKNGVPACLKAQELQKKLDELKASKESLGLFSGRKKKELQMEIQAVRSEMDELKPAIAEQQAPFEEKAEDFDQQVRKIDQQLAGIVRLLRTGDYEF